jgi:serine/threonine-protein kinase HipA
MVNEARDNAEVKIWNQSVGALSFDRNTGLGSFQYRDSWLATEIELFPLQMPLSKEVYAFPSLPNKTFRGLPAGLADTLPDDFGNAVINAWLASQGRDTTQFSPVERLLYTGKRGMGALEYSPAVQVGSSKTVELDVNEMVQFAQKIVSEHESFAMDIASKKNRNLEALFQIGTSAGGARPKAVIAVNAARTSVLSGQIDVPEGYEHYLIKFDGVDEHSAGKETFDDPKGFGRMEYAYFKMARDAGINIMHCELLERGGLAHFMTKRFDRIGRKKLHYQSLCAMDHADYRQPGLYSYEELLQTMRRLRLPRTDAVELYRRMVFNVVARNQDDHTKNFGFMITEDGDWSLAPAFDIAYSYKQDSQWINSHNLSINGKRDDFTRADLLAVGKGISNFYTDAELIINEVTSVVARWEEYASEAEVFPKLQKLIAGNIRLNL